MDAIQRLKMIKEKNDKLVDQKNNLTTELRIEESKLKDSLAEIGLTSADQIKETREQLEKELESMISQAEGLLANV